MATGTRPPLHLTLLQPPPPPKDGGDARRPGASLSWSLVRYEPLAPTAVPTDVGANDEEQGPSRHPSQRPTSTTTVVDHQKSDSSVSAVLTRYTHWMSRTWMRYLRHVQSDWLWRASTLKNGGFVILGFVFWYTSFAYGNTVDAVPCPVYARWLTWVVAVAWAATVCAAMIGGVRKSIGSDGCGRLGVAIEVTGDVMSLLVGSCMLLVTRPTTRDLDTRVRTSVPARCDFRHEGHALTGYYTGVVLMFGGAARFWIRGAVNNVVAEWLLLRTFAWSLGCVFVATWYWILAEMVLAPIVCRLTRDAGHAISCP